MSNYLERFISAFEKFAEAEAAKAEAAIGTRLDMQGWGKLLGDMADFVRGQVQPSTTQFDPVVLPPIPNPGTEAAAPAETANPQETSAPTETASSAEAASQPETSAPTTDQTAPSTPETGNEAGV